MKMGDSAGSDELFEKFRFGEAERQVLMLGATVLDAKLTAVETNRSEQEKKLRVLGKRREALDHLGVDFDGIEEALRTSVSHWSVERRALLLVELCFAQPFSPYELKCRKADRLEVLRSIAELIELSPEKLDAILASIKSARQAHRHIPWGRAVVGGVVGATVLGVAGWAAAPFLGAYLGISAGLSGAAAVSHGLALLGGGTLAAGGWGMAGGLWLVTGVGATLGVSAFGGGTLLYGLGANATAAELVKLQVSFQQVILDGQFREAKKAVIIDALVGQQTALRTELNEEREMNDKNARRLKEIEKIIEAYGDSIRWMREQASAELAS